MRKTTAKSSVPVINSRLSTLLLLSINSALLVGCSMISSELEMVVKNELEQKLERYTELEPEIQRMLALESDMQIIVSELARYSTLGSDPMGSPTSKSSGQADTNQIQNNTENNAEVTSSNSENKTGDCSTKLNAANGHCNMKIGLHIAAFRDEKFVLPGWLYLVKKLPAELTEGKRPLSTEIVQHDITYQSLRVGPFTSVYQATTVCEQARHLVSCAVVEYRGRKVES
jgi:hypothetical protein